MGLQNHVGLYVMRFIVLAIIICLAGCAEQRQARFEAFAAPCKAIPAERGSAVRRAECINAAAEQAGFHGGAEGLLEASRISLSVNVDNGTITAAEASLRYAKARYQVQQIETLEQAQRAGTEAALLKAMPQPKPYVGRPQPYVVQPSPVRQPWKMTCTSDDFFTTTTTTCTGN